MTSFGWSSADQLTLLNFDQNNLKKGTHTVKSLPIICSHIGVTHSEHSWASTLGFKEYI